MIDRFERDRLLYALAGAVVIHLVVFAFIQFVYPSGERTPEPQPIYVQLTAPKVTEVPIERSIAEAPASQPNAATSNASAARPAVAQPKSQPKPSPAQAPATQRAQSAAREIDPLAGPPVESQAPPTPRTAPQSDFQEAPAAPTAEDIAQNDEQAAQLEQWRAEHPVARVAPGTASAGPASTAPSESATGKPDAVQKKINETFSKIQPTEAANGSGSVQPQTSTDTSQTSPPASQTSPTYTDSRLQFPTGTPVRSLMSQGRLQLKQALVESILAQHPNHPSRIVVPVTFDVLPNGFVTNLQLVHGSGYTQLDQAIENLFNGQVFRAATTDAPIVGASIEYVIETR